MDLWELRNVEQKERVRDGQKTKDDFILDVVTTFAQACFLLLFMPFIEKILHSKE